MSHLNPFASWRNHYQPSLPSLLKNLNQTQWSFVDETSESVLNQEISELFPLTSPQKILKLGKGPKKPSRPLKVGVLFSGGQASGGHNVISGLLDALKQLDQSSTLIGFLNGPLGLIENNYTVLDQEAVAPFRNSGGFHLIGSGRTKIESDAQFKAAAETLQAHQLDGLVIIGGDDSNTNAACLAEYCVKHQIFTTIVGVPKTIDGDLKNKYIEVSFGFDTASKTYSEIIGNICQDILSSKKYYFFMKMMGRTASHLTLECALQTQPNLAFISEEVAAKEMTLKDVVDQIVDLVVSRAKEGKNYGMILIPEGLLEFLSDCREMLKEINSFLVNEKGVTLEECILKLSKQSKVCLELFPEAIRVQLFFDRDPHGNVQLAKIETERLLIALVEQELHTRKANRSFIAQPFYCGYEGRSAFPSNFDATYCYSLGHLAALLILEKATGYLCSILNLQQPVENWVCMGVPIVKMLHFEIRKGQRKPVIEKGLVDLKGKPMTLLISKRKGWMLNDEYISTGPIQFEGPEDVKDKTTLTLELETPV